MIEHYYANLNASANNTPNATSDNEEEFEQVHLPDATVILPDTLESEEEEDDEEFVQVDETASVLGKRSRDD